LRIARQERALGSHRVSNAAPLWLARATMAALCCHFALQIFLPLRHHLYPGDVCWTEEGFRFSWNVMLTEKTGRVTFHVSDQASGRQWLVYPGDYLTAQQESMMATQPDMILALAHHIARDYPARGVAHPEVRAEAYASLNGRPSQLLVDPEVDLAREHDGLGPKTGIVPLSEPAADRWAAR
jgi:hypothetical protein